MSKDHRVFSGDVIITGTVAQILLDEKCADFIETGTLDGGTSLGVHRLFPHLNVWTTERHAGRYRDNQELFEGTGILHFLGDSPDVLRERILPNLTAARPFFYLDAHAPDSFPILDELRAIATIARLRPIICIHDFWNPLRPDFTCEVDPNGKKLDMEYIRDALRQVYPGQITTHFFNSQAVGHQIGVVYIGVVK